MKAGKSTVLLVDDDHDVVWGVGKCLARAGFSVTTCGDGEEAIKVLESRDFDVLITDIKMPRVNGLALVDWARRNRPSVKVVVMTAFGSPSIRHLTLGKGAMLYLEKPVDPGLLVDVISSLGRTSAFHGSLDDIDILDYLQLMMLTGRQMILEVLSRGGERGLLFVDKGDITHAVCCGIEGEEAVYRCLSFDGGSFSNLPWDAPAERTIDKPGEFLLVQAARLRDEKRAEAN